MLNKFSLGQKLTALALFATVLMIVLATHFLPAARASSAGVEVAEPICPIVCPPGH